MAIATASSVGPDDSSTSLSSFSFDEPTLDWLVRERVISDRLANYLATYRFDGDVVRLLRG